MTLGELLLQYRKDNNLTQRDLATRLGVSDMTISRIESGSRYKSSQPFADALLALFSAEELLALSDHSLLDLQNPNTDKQKFIAPDGWKMHSSLVSQCTHSGLFLRSDFPHMRSFYDVKIHLPNNKLWLVNFLHVSTSSYSLSNARKGKYLDLIYSNLGMCCCYPELIHKYSIITNIDVSQLNFQNHSHPHQYPAQKLGHDVSLIHFDSTTNRLDYERNLAFFSDGRGAFDLDVNESQPEAAALYARWMRALNDIIPSSSVPMDSGSINNA